MKVTTIKAADIFPKMKGPSANLDLPYGEYDENDPADQALMALIPKEDPFYRFPGVDTTTALLVMSERDNILVHGSTGTGKSSLPSQLCFKLNLPLTRVNCYAEMGAPELFGYMGLQNPNIPHDDGWKWTSVTLGIQRPGILLLDEWDALRPDAAIGLQRLLEDNGPGLMLPDIDRFIPKNEDCIVFATANTRGLGDATGLYAGTGSQNFAQLNRFHVVMEMAPLDKDKMELVLNGVTVRGNPLKPDLVTSLVSFYQMTLDSYQAGQLSCPLSPRMMMHLARYYTLAGPPAISLVVLSKLPTEEDKAAARGLADRAGLIDQER